VKFSVRVLEERSFQRWEDSPMEQFVHNENLKLYRQKLSDPTVGDAVREQIRKLLAEEEAKDTPSPCPHQTSSPGR
jgi:hypothetical protein